MVRRATEADAASLAALSIEVWIGTYLREGVGATFAEYALNEYTPDRMRARITDPKQVVIASANAQGLDGYIRVALHAVPPVAACRGAEIATLYVQPRHHGRGIGRALLAEAFARCQPRGIDAVWLTVNAENTAAIGFYRALGFRTVGQTEFVIDGRGYPNDVMACDLRAWSARVPSVDRAVSLRKQYHSRRVGLDRHIWDVHRLIHAARDLPVRSVPLSEIAELDEDWWYADDGDHRKDDTRPTPRSIAEHMTLAEAADPTHPIILCADGRLMDGMHRVVRALAEGRTHIDAVRFPITPEPDYLNVTLDDLPYPNEVV